MDEVAVEAIADPKRYIEALGLHDVRVHRLEFDPKARTIAVTVPDLHANWTDLPEDPGRRPCTLVFRGVAMLFCDFETSEGIWITAERVVERGSVLRLELDFQSGGGDATGGRRSLVIDFERLEIKDL